MWGEAYFFLDFFGPFCIKAKQDEKHSFLKIEIGDLAFRKYHKWSIFELEIAILIVEILLPDNSDLLINKISNPSDR